MVKLSKRYTVVIAVCVCAVTVVAALAVIYSGPPGAPSQPGGYIAKDPADIALASGDLPGWEVHRSGAMEIPETIAYVGFENGYEREFRKGAVRLTSRAERFSTAEGAGKVFDSGRSVMGGLVPYGFAAPVEHQTVGDNSFVFQKFDTSYSFEGYSAAFRRSNFLVSVFSGYDNAGEVTLQDIIGYMQTCEGRLG